MFFVSVSSACTVMFLVFESMFASYFVECYVWPCVMFEERFTLCFKVVGEFSNGEIYVLVLFHVCWSPGLASFPFASKVLCFFLAAPSLINISHIDVTKRYYNKGAGAGFFIVWYQVWRPIIGLYIFTPWSLDLFIHVSFQLPGSIQSCSSIALIAHITLWPTRYSFSPESSEAFGGEVSCPRTHHLNNVPILRG